jgi:glucose-1-phosphate cytidylyltransferase
MKVILLAGGFGTRLSEYTEDIPKPMVPIGGKPILWHIMDIFAQFGHNDFYIALGYKAEIVKDYFLNYRMLNSNFTLDLNNGSLVMHDVDCSDWKVTLVQTGLDSMTGGRIKRMKKFIGDETCMITYGDGLANVDLNKLLDFHKSHGKMVTVTAVHPGARFGELKIENDKVLSFQEKPQMTQGWINGGFFVVEPGFFDLIEGDKTILERDPLEKVASMGELMAYRHDGFWQCMDTKRDKDYLEDLWNSDNIEWRKF